MYSQYWLMITLECKQRPYCDPGPAVEVDPPGTHYKGWGSSMASPFALASATSKWALVPCFARSFKR